MKRLRITPISLSEANAFVAEGHDIAPVPDAKFCIAASDENDVVRGVAIVGCGPGAHISDNDLTLYVLRACTDGEYDAQTVYPLLSRAAWLATRALGYLRLIGLERYRRHSKLYESTSR